jgi:hypothetical protein
MFVFSNVFPFLYIFNSLQSSLTGSAEKSTWDQANRWQKLGLAWRKRKKISQIINNYLFLSFFLLIIFWVAVMTVGCIV